TPSDMFGRHLEQRLPDVLALSRASKGSFGKMDDDQFANAILQERSSGVSQCHGIELAGGLPDFEAGRFSRFDFVQNTIVRKLERGRDDRGEAIAVLADDID